VEPLALWWLPLEWGNQFFDRCVGRLGKPARWLRRPSGRALLGWSGLMLLAGALALLLWDWIRIRW
jgi:hypothetical protein